MDAGLQGRCGAPPWAGTPSGHSGGASGLALHAGSGAAASSAAVALPWDWSMSCGMDVPGLLSGALSLASRGGISSAASCVAPAELPPLQDWPAAGGLRGPGPRPSLQCELAAAAHGWPAMAAARGSPGHGSVDFGPPCLTTRGSAPGALGGRPAVPLRARRPPPAQASAWLAAALPPAHPCSAAPARACSVAPARGALDWAGGGVPGFPYGLDRKAELAAPLAPSPTPAAAPGSAISPFSVAAAFEMHGAFLGAAAAPFEALGPAAFVAGGGAGSGGKWLSPRSAAGAVPGATAASSGSNASEDTAGLPLGLDFRTALATLQARPRQVVRQVLDRAGPAAADRRGVRGGRGHDQLRRRAGQDDPRADHLAAAAAGAAVRRQRVPGDGGAARPPPGTLGRSASWKGRIGF